MKVCKKCQKMKSYKKFSLDKQKKDGYYSSCKLCKSKVNKIYFNNNKERESNRQASKYIKNRDACIERSKRYNKLNLDKRRAWRAKRRAAKLKATLPGYNKEIMKIYENCPDGYHVDHIVPLQGKEVSGLHVPWNLQYLPASENLSKGNKLIL